MRRICWRFYDTMTVHKFQQIFYKEVEFCMRAQWTGGLVGQMHNEKVTKTELAVEMGVTREYVSMVLNGHREPAGAEDNFQSALNRIIERKKQVSQMPTE